MIQSMTGYASGQGAFDGYRWSWELRSVNGKGLDLRLRVPDWIEGLEPALRAALGKIARRGNVTFSLRVQRDETDSGLRLNPVVLSTTLTALAEIEARAKSAGLTLHRPSAADIAGLRGVLDAGVEDRETSGLKDALIAALPKLTSDFSKMRADEGLALHKVITGQIDEIETMTGSAQDLLVTRKEQMSENLRRNLSRVLETVADLDDGRIAQELALIAVKTDVTEEIDRLQTHIAAAKSLLDQTDAVGRKLDFLCQEFNREANTLCSKAQMSELTEIGLALKVTIDQMREQIQNVE